MSFTKGLGLFKALRNTVNVKNQVRHAGGTWSYRKIGHVNKSSFILGDGIMAFAVWWIVWHVWHQPGHIVGEFPYPDPSKWTDAELGIPPDDED